MNHFFSKNLNLVGRLVRGIGGSASIIAAVMIHGDWPRTAMLLGVGGLFGILQALRGWCLLRACGAKLPF